MKKWLVAAVMLLATQASAATIDGPVDVEGGKGYWYRGSVADLAFDPALYTTWSIKLTVNGLASQYVIDGVTLGTNRPAGFRFFYTFGSIIPPSLNVSATLDRHVDGSYGVTSSFGFQNITVRPGTKTVSDTIVFDPLYLNGAVPPFQQTGESLQEQGNGLVTKAAAVVPLGGALPMLLSALAALGWVARSRAKAKSVVA